MTERACRSTALAGRAILSSALILSPLLYPEMERDTAEGNHGERFSNASDNITVPDEVLGRAGRYLSRKREIISHARKYEYFLNYVRWKNKQMPSYLKLIFVD